jgi:methylenetetrahydrofolate reductase (NADPH)
MGREEMLLEVLPPLDWDKVGTETWSDVVHQIRKTGSIKFIKDIFSKDKLKKSRTWDSVFKTIRQPDWWRGDSDYHAPGYQEPVSEFEKRLRSGNFVIATEVTPPLSADTKKLSVDIEIVKPYVTAINFTDSSSARPRMSSIACSKVALDHNVEPILQIAARDITRTGLQAEIIGVNEMGIFNVLCITGDSAKVGPSPRSNMNLLDIDSVQMIWLMRRMRDEGIYLDGRKMKNPPKMFIGAASTPFASDPALQALRDHKKVNAGAQFFQTNLVFDALKLDLWLEQLDKRNILNKVFILIGIAPLKSFKVAEYLHTKVPGVNLPDKILTRMKKAGAGAPEEGIQIALELIGSIKKKKGVNGIHIMSLGWESIVGRIVTDSGLIR